MRADVWILGRSKVPILWSKISTTMCDFVSIMINGFYSIFPHLYTVYNSLIQSQLAYYRLSKLVCYLLKPTLDIARKKNIWWSHSDYHTSFKASFSFRQRSPKYLGFSIVKLQIFMNGYLSSLNSVIEVYSDFSFNAIQIPISFIFDQFDASICLLGLFIGKPHQFSYRNRNNFLVQMSMKNDLSSSTMAAIILFVCFMIVMLFHCILGCLFSVLAIEPVLSFPLSYPLWVKRKDTQSQTRNWNYFGFTFWSLGGCKHIEVVVSVTHCIFILSSVKN